WIVAELCPHLLYVGPQYPRVVRVPIPPDVGQDRIVLEEPARIGGKKRQELELGSGQVGLVAVHEYQMLRRVDLELPGRPILTRPCIIFGGPFACRFHAFEDEAEGDCYKEENDE